MRNEYAGTCYRCGLRVEPGAGHFEKVRGRPGDPKWRTQHAGCAILWRGTDKRAGDGKKLADFADIEDAKDRVKDVKRLHKEKPAHFPILSKEPTHA